MVWEASAQSMGSIITELSAFVGDQVVLDGNLYVAPTTNKGSLRFYWQQISGPTVELEHKESAVASFIAKDTGLHQFTVAIYNGATMYETHPVSVSVYPKTGMINCSSASPPNGVTFPNSILNLAIVLTPAVVLGMRRLRQRID